MYSFPFNSLVDSYTTNLVLSNSILVPVVITGKVSGAQSPRLSLQRVAASDVGSYWVAVTNAAAPANGITSQPGILSVNDPGIVVNPTNLTRYAGTSARLFVNAGGTPPLYYQWRKDGASLASDALITNIGSGTVTMARGALYLPAVVSSVTSPRRQSTRSTAADVRISNPVHSTRISWS